MSNHAAAQPAQWLTVNHTAVTAAVYTVLCLAAALGATRLWRASRRTATTLGTAAGKPKRRRKVSAGTLAAIVAFIVCTSVSLNTSYRFTGDPQGLAMTDEFERWLSCAAYESLMAMCVLGARERMAGEAKSPGWYGTAVWVFAGLSSIPAAIEGDGLFTASTAVRVIVGSFGSALAAHSALGLDLRHRTGEDSEAPTAIIMRDLRERLMSRLGLTQRARSAQQIAQERALTKAVDLRDRYERLDPKKKEGRKGARLAKRLGHALDAAGVAENQAQKDAYHRRAALREHATSLVISDKESPWLDTSTVLAAELDARADRMTTVAEGIEAALLEQIDDLPAESVVPAPRSPLVPVDDIPAECVDQHPPADETNPSGRAAAAAGSPRTVTIPITDDEPEDPTTHQRPSYRPKADVDVSGYPTKTAALLAVYEAEERWDDDRPTNAVAQDLCARYSIDMDRGQAWRVIDQARAKAAEETQDVPTEAHSAREHCTV